MEFTLTSEGNPTLLGLIGFLVPFTNTMFCLCGFQGTGPVALASVSASYYFFGGIAMVLAGIAEFILGNSFPFAIFIIYGAHWTAVAYGGDPAHPLAAAYQGGAINPEYNAGQGIYNINMVLVTFVFLIGSIRTNAPFVVLFLALIFVFSFVAAGYLELAHNHTAEGLEYALKLFKIAGGFGFVTVVMGW